MIHTTASDESQMHYVKGKKPDSKGYRLYDSIYMAFGQKQTKGLGNRSEGMRLRVGEHFGEMEMFYNFIVVTQPNVFIKTQRTAH